MSGRITRLGFPATFIMLCLVLASSVVQAADNSLPYSEVLGKLNLKAPADTNISQQLGLKKNAEHFRLTDLRPGIVILEIFNMYCPHCQHFAPTANELYRLIQADPAVRERVQLLGVGAGNSPFEVGVFQKKYAVEFPLIDDKDYAVSNLMEGLRTPHFFAFIVDGQGGYRVLYSKSGGFQDAQGFLSDVLRQARTGSVWK